MNLKTTIAELINDNMLNFAGLWDKTVSLGYSREDTLKALNTLTKSNFVVVGDNKRYELTEQGEDLLAGQSISITTTAPTSKPKPKATTPTAKKPITKGAKVDVTQTILKALRACEPLKYSELHAKVNETVAIEKGALSIRLNKLKTAQLISQDIDRKYVLTEIGEQKLNPSDKPAPLSSMATYKQKEKPAEQAAQSKQPTDPEEIDANMDMPEPTIKKPENNGTICLDIRKELVADEITFIREFIEKEYGICDVPDAGVFSYAIKHAVAAIKVAA